MTDPREQHRPTDPSAIAAEVVRLNRQGLLVRDIAQALKLNPAEVAKILVRSTLTGASR